MAAVAAAGGLSVVLLAASLLVLALARPAQAHAVLVSTSPDDGATLAAEPAQVELRFNENVGTPAYLIVRAPDGTRAERGTTKVVDGTVRRATKALGIAGRYSMSYRVVSTDGHPVEGIVHFVVREGRTVEQVDDSPSRSFVHRHVAHLAWGTAGVVTAGVLLLWPRRRRDA